MSIGKISSFRSFVRSSKPGESLFGTTERLTEVTLGIPKSKLPWNKLQSQSASFHLTILLRPFA